MKSVKFFFLIAIIVCIFFYILYLEMFSLVLLIIMLGIPSWAFVTIRTLKRCLKAELSVIGGAAVKNEPFNVQLKMRNRSIFPVGKAMALVRYTNTLSQESSVIELHFPIQARNSQYLTFQLSSKYSGKIHLNVEKFTVYDPLRIFKLNLFKDCETGAVILPSVKDIDGYVNDNTLTLHDSDIFSKHRPGDAPSEVFDMREYKIGDKISRIHWKLSSKKGELIVKDYSFPIDLSVVVFIDFSFSANFGKDSETVLPIFDTVLETAASLSNFLAENERIHTLIAYSHKTNDFEMYTVNGPEDIYMAINKCIEGFDAFNKGKDITDFVKVCELRFSSFTYISAEIPETTVEIIEESFDSPIMNIISVINDTASEGRNYSDSRAAVTEVPIGKISAAIKEIEL